VVLIAAGLLSGCAKSDRDAADRREARQTSAETREASEPVAASAVPSVAKRSASPKADAVKLKAMESPLADISPSEPSPPRSSNGGLGTNSGTGLLDPADSAESTTKVRVFYATDRNVEETADAAGCVFDRWYYFTSVAAGLTIALALICIWRPRRTWQVASALGLTATGMVGCVTLYLGSRGLPLTAPQRLYGNERGTMELGVCDVTIPRSHELGHVERPTILRIELIENPLRHVVLRAVKQLPAERFYRELKTRVEASQRKEAFVFIHGYNVDFASAARRTAQIAYDLQFEGAPIFYSWPSQGDMLGYTIDETNVVWTVPHLKEFLLNVAKQSGAEAVHLVAHSMGNRALTSALKELFYELDADCPKFHDVVLTAPDIDAETFRRDLAPAIIKTAKRVTLYASSNDEALVLSKRMHGYARAGDSGEYLVVVPGMDTIDVSEVDTSLLGHSYYGNNHTVLADLYDLLREWKPPEERKFLRSMSLGSLRYWSFVR